MPPKKPKGLMAILRKSGNAQPKFKAYARPGSAFSELSNGKGRSVKRTHLDSDNEDEDDIPRKKRSRKATTTKVEDTEGEVIPPPEPAEPVVESWRPAGGEQELKDELSLKYATPTTKLGLARISTWRVPTFLTAVEAIIMATGEEGDAETAELIHGGESVTDVFYSFRTDLVAGMVMEEIQGQLVDGRVLQVTFA
ncbi:hypothetical protein LTR56_008188 [Elasticomyces elasticus]|nr:hypothetical protein LTR56_008188 [Elasticomyces elasticus]KAK3661753.1 hypothetical protein LTR22_007334 [Elasticomyces elasticus]KAK4924358.1 hypothetical protein LTR49_008447 [Elasticomyces elasticus]